MENSRETSARTNEDEVEWCFAVPSDRGIVEVRIRSNGEVVWMGGSDPVKWVCLDLSFPTAEFKPLQVVRNDILKIDSSSSFEDTDLAGKRYVYHYTRADTAITKILPDQRLRMSPYRDLNDPREAKEWFFSVVAPKGAIEPGKSVDIGRSISEYIQGGARVLLLLLRWLLVTARPTRRGNLRHHWMASSEHVGPLRRESPRRGTGVS